METNIVFDVEIIQPCEGQSSKRMETNIVFDVEIIGFELKDYKILTQLARM